MRPISRTRAPSFGQLSRGALCLLLAAAGLAACGDDDSDDESGGSSGGATESEPATIRYVNTAVTAGNTVPWIADEQGIAEEHDIEIDMITVQDPSAAMSAVLSGSADVTPTGWSSLAAVQQQGEDVRWACRGVPAGATTILAEAGSGLPTFESTDGDFETFMQELSDRDVKWAVNARGGEFELRARAVAAAGGLDPDSFDYVPVALGPATVAALLNGDVDVMISAGLSRQQLVGDGSGEVLWDFQAAGPDVARVFSYVGFAVKADWADDNAEALERFCDVIDGTKDFMADTANTSILEEMLETRFEMTIPEQVELSVEGLQTDWFDEQVPEEAFDEAVDFFVDSGVLKPEPRITRDRLLWP